MTEWILIIGGVIGGLLLATHAAGVGFIASRVFLSGGKKLKQFSPTMGPARVHDGQQPTS